MGVLRAGEESREHGLRGVLVGSIPERGFPVSPGAAPLGLGIPPRVPGCPAVGPGSSLGTMGPKLSPQHRLLAGGAPYFLMLKRLQKSRWHRVWVPVWGVPAPATAGAGGAH